MAMELKHLNPQHVMDVTGKAIDEISRLRAENAELKAENAELKAKLESEKESRYAESVDAGMRERRLKRALYKACANWAKAYRYPSFRKFESRCLKMAEKYK